MAAQSPAQNQGVFMKIVNYKAFSAMKPGTIFCKYREKGGPLFGPLSCKADSLGNDFVCQEWIANFKYHNTDSYKEGEEKMERGEDVPLDFEFFGRDGLFELDQLYAVYSRQDVKDLIKALKSTLE